MSSSKEVARDTPSVEVPDRRTTTNAEKAHALMSLLESPSRGEGTSNVAPERLRAWARDLVEEVERRKDTRIREDYEIKRSLVLASEMGGSKTDREDLSSYDELAEGSEVPKLFSRPAPRLSDHPETRNLLCEALEIVNPKKRPKPKIVLLPETEGQEGDLLFRGASRDRENHLQETGNVKAVKQPMFASSKANDVDFGRERHGAAREGRSNTTHSLLRPLTEAQTKARDLISAGIDPNQMGQEHPAVIAVALLGQSSRDQARTLRTMPGRQVRAVNRLLREIEETIVVSA